MISSQHLSTLPTLAVITYNHTRCCCAKALAITQGHPRLPFSQSDIKRKDSLLLQTGLKGALGLLSASQPAGHGVTRAKWLYYYYIIVMVKTI